MSESICQFLVPYIFSEQWLLFLNKLVPTIPQIKLQSSEQTIYTEQKCQITTNQYPRLCIFKIGFEREVVDYIPYGRYAWSERNLVNKGLYRTFLFENPLFFLFEEILFQILLEFCLDNTGCFHANRCKHTYTNTYIEIYTNKYTFKQLNYYGFG